MYLAKCVPLSDTLWQVLRSAVIHILPLHAVVLLYPVSWDGLSTKVTTTHGLVLL